MFKIILINYFIAFKMGHIFLMKFRESIFKYNNYYIFIIIINFLFKIKIKNIYYKIIIITTQIYLHFKFINTLVFKMVP